MNTVCQYRLNVWEELVQLLHFPLHYIIVFMQPQECHKGPNWFVSEEDPAINFLTWVQSSRLWDTVNRMAADGTG